MDETRKPIEIGILVFPNVTQLDLTGPYEVLSRVSDARVHLLWQDTKPVVSDRGLILTPTLAFASAHAMDVILVPGGPGVGPLMEDETVLAFLRKQVETVRYVTSVCTGALVLGAAGLLRGYHATTHWTALSMLTRLGAIASSDRIVVDRNRITGGGVTAGIDFALRLVATLRTEDEARLIQLQMEYNPAPPFDSGHPDTADPAIVSRARAAAAKMSESRMAIVDRVAARLSH